MKTFFLLVATLLLPAAPLSGQISLRNGPDATPADLAQLNRILDWQSLQPGLEVAEFAVEAGRLGMNVRIIVARMDLNTFDFRLVHATRANRMTGAWTVDAAPADAALALNAGQFKETGPWGWLVLNGVEKRDPGFGPLSVGIAFDTTGRLNWIPFKELAQNRAGRAIRFAFQSYPALLLDGAVPQMAAGSAIDQSHRDIRLILAQDTDGRLLILLTRYDALGGALARMPIGLTVPESIDVVRALGARHAVMLDGGVSAQMLLRDRNGEARVWKGMRAVPLALVAFPRERS